MADFIISDHAKQELERRAIPERLLREVFAKPQQVIAGREGREVYQSVLEFPDGRSSLLRIILTRDTLPPTVITVYRTSKVDKYWRRS